MDTTVTTATNGDEGAYCPSASYASTAQDFQGGGSSRLIIPLQHASQWGHTNSTTIALPDGSQFTLAAYMMRFQNAAAQAQDDSGFTDAAAAATFYAARVQDAPMRLAPGAYPTTTTFGTSGVPNDQGAPDRYLGARGY